MFSSEIGVRKPDPRIFQEALRRVGGQPAGTVFVGDRLYDDVGGAQTAGMRAIQTVQFRREEEQEPRPDAVIEHLSDRREQALDLRTLRFQRAVDLGLVYLNQRFAGIFEGPLRQGGEGVRHIAAGLLDVREACLRHCPPKLGALHAPSADQPPQKHTHPQRD